VGVNLDRVDWRSLAQRHRFRLKPMARATGTSVRSVQRTFHRLYGGTVRKQFEVWRRELTAEMLRANRFNMKEIGDASPTTVVAGPQSDLPILPSYYEVVWVVRVR